jgi:hypothetical protein
MTVHETAERLSAYLDRELPPPQTQQLERHLEACSDCRRHLESLRRVVGQLERLERRAPPPLLAGEVARRVALEGRPRSLVERLESRLVGRTLESSTLTTFALVLALAVIGFLFVDTVEKIERKKIPVVVASPEASAEFSRQHEIAVGTRVEAAGRMFVLREGAWRQEGFETVEPETDLDAASEAGRALLERHPGLAPLLTEGRAVVLEEGGQVVRLSRAER